MKVVDFRSQEDPRAQIKVKSEIIGLLKQIECISQMQRSSLKEHISLFLVRKTVIDYNEYILHSEGTSTS